MPSAMKLPAERTIGNLSRRRLAAQRRAHRSISPPIVLAESATQAHRLAICPFPQEDDSVECFQVILTRTENCRHVRFWAFVSSSGLLFSRFPQMWRNLWISPASPCSEAFTERRGARPSFEAPQETATARESRRGRRTVNTRVEPQPERQPVGAVLRGIVAPGGRRRPSGRRP